MSRAELKDRAVREAEEREAALDDTGPEPEVEPEAAPAEVAVATGSVRDKSQFLAKAIPLGGSIGGGNG